MQTVTNTSTEALAVPMLGCVLQPGESVEVADASPFEHHPFLTVGGAAVPKPEPTPEPTAEPVVEPEPEPIVEVATPTSSVSQAEVIG